MKKELQQRLKDKHPNLLEELIVYKKRGMDDYSLPIKKYGIECDNGWYTLLHVLFSAIENICRNEYTIPRVQVIKQKMGRLVVYIDDVDEEITKDVYDKIHYTEMLSGYICENCGSSVNAVTRELKYGGIKTLCGDCLDK